MQARVSVETHCMHACQRSEVSDLLYIKTPALLLEAGCMGALHLSGNDRSNA